MKGLSGFLVNGIASLYIIAFVVIFCFPFLMPVSAMTINYTSLITGCFSLFVGAFWFWRRGDYDGPHFVPLESAILAKYTI
jgi:choline transport protein